MKRRSINDKEFIRDLLIENPSNNIFRIHKIGLDS
jgi:hypothetical protein